MIAKLYKYVALTGMVVFMARSAQARINVVTTTEDLAAIVREVGGDKVDVVPLAKGYQDPHFVDAKPSYLIKLQRADLLVVVGRDLEIGWAPRLVDSARNPKILQGARGYLDASANVPMLEMATGQVSRAQGDIHPFGNPHYWLDPMNGKYVAGTIEKKLADISPADAAYFHARTEDFTKRLDARVAQWEEKARQIGLTGLKVVTYHKSWSYLAKRLGFEVLDFIEPKPGIPPSPQHLQNLNAQIKSKEVKLIIIEPFFDAKLPQKIALETGAKLVVLPTSVGADKSILTYFDLFERQLDLLSGVLKKGG